MSTPDPRTLLVELSGLASWRREAALGELGPDGVAGLGGAWMRAILAQAQHAGTPDVRDRLIGHGFHLRDLDAAALDVAAVAVLQGDFKAGEAAGRLAGPAAPYLAALAAVERLGPDVPGTIEGLRESARSEAEMMLLAAAGLRRLGEDGAAEGLLSAAVDRLFVEGDMFRTVFWQALDLLAECDPDLEARVVRIVVSLAVDREDVVLAQAISRRLLQRSIADEQYRRQVCGQTERVARALLDRADQLSAGAVEAAAIALHLCALGVGDAMLAAQGLQIAAQMSFVQGRTLDGVERQRGFAYYAGRGHRSQRILAAPVLWRDEIGDLPSAKSFSLVGDLFDALDPMPRVEGLPVTDYYAPLQSWVAELRDAEIVSGDTLGSVFHYVLTDEKSLILDGLNIHPSYHMGRTVESFRALSPTDEVLLDLSARNDPTRLRGRFALIGGVANYYHWLFEYLPRLGLLRDAGFDFSEHIFLINAAPSDWQLETLELAGVNEHRVQALSGDYGALVDMLVLPSAPSTRYAVAFLQDAFPAKEALPHRIIYISRVDVRASRSRVANEAEVIDHMLTRGAYIMVASDETFQSQVDLFRAVSLVVAPHGAGLANLAFCPEGTGVIELNNKTNCNYTFFERIAEAAKLRFKRYVGDEEVRHGPPEDAATVVDIARLSAMIDSLLKSKEV